MWPKTVALVGLSLASFCAAEIAGKPEAILKLEPYRKGVAIRMEVKGHPGLFTFDTAGGITIISSQFATTIGCAPWGQLVGYQMTGNRLAAPRCDNVTFAVDGYSLTAPVAGVLDVSALIAADAAPIEGSLALDVFAGKTITIDFAAGELIVESPQSAAERVQDARELPLTLSREVGGLALAPLVHIPTRSGPLRFELDSGNGGTILVSKPYAMLFDLDPDADGAQQGSVRLADGLEAKGLIFTPDLTIDGNIGMPFLKDWAITLDLAASRLWLRPSRATPPEGMGVPPQMPTSH